MHWKVLLFIGAAIVILGRAIWPDTQAPTHALTPSETFQAGINNAKHQIFEGCLRHAGTTLDEVTAGQALVTSYPSGLLVSSESFNAEGETGAEISIKTRDLIDKEVIRKLSCHLVYKGSEIVRQRFLIARWGQLGWYPNCTGRSCF